MNAKGIHLLKQAKVIAMVSILNIPQKLLCQGLVPNAAVFRGLWEVTDHEDFELMTRLIQLRIHSLMDYGGGALFCFLAAMR
jgi:hypothetical protein